MAGNSINQYNALKVPKISFGEGQVAPVEQGPAFQMHTLSEDKFESTNPFLTTNLPAQSPENEKKSNKGWLIAGGTVVALGALGIAFHKPIGKWFGAGKAVAKEGDKILPKKVVIDGIELIEEEVKNDTGRVLKKLLKRADGTLFSEEEVQGMKKIKTNYLDDGVKIKDRVTADNVSKFEEIFTDGVRTSSTSYDLQVSKYVKTFERTYHPGGDAVKTETYFLKNIRNSETTYNLSKQKTNQKWFVDDGSRVSHEFDYDLNTNNPIKYTHYEDVDKIGYVVDYDPKVGGKDIAWTYYKDGKKVRTDRHMEDIAVEGVDEVTHFTENESVFKTQYHDRVNKKYYDSLEDLLKANGKPTETPKAVATELDKNLEAILGDCKDERVVDKIKRSQAKIAKELSEAQDDLTKYNAYIDSIDDMNIFIEMERQKNSNDSIVSALKRYQDSMKNDLKKMGVEEIDASVGTKFDMTRHSVEGVRLTDDPEKVDTIAEIFRPGFMKDGQGIRPAEVITYKLESKPVPLPHVQQRALISMEEYSNELKNIDLNKDPLLIQMSNIFEKFAESCEEKKVLKVLASNHLDLIKGLSQTSDEIGKCKEIIRKMDDIGVNKKGTDDDSARSLFTRYQRKLWAVLEEMGVEEVVVPMNAKFDASKYNAVNTKKAPSPDLIGEIAAVSELGLRKGNEVLKKPEVIIYSAS